MEIKFTIQGYLIYAAMAMYLLGFIMSIVRQHKFGRVLYFSGFLVTSIAFGYRWYHTGHVPLQNLFEVFLCLGMVIWPITVFCRRVLAVGGDGADMLIGFIVLFPAGFVFSAEPQKLPPALQCWLFAPHVAVYMLSYIIMAKATVQAFAQICKRPCGQGLCDYELATYRMVRAGFPFLTLGLILGSVWGKLAWGDYWGWDPKELWSLVSWLVYIGYFHWRYMFGRKIPASNSIWAIVGMIAIIITLLWVNLSKIFIGLHSYAV